MNRRGISRQFIDDLKTGSLCQVLEAVLCDDTLCMEIRDGYINIYYRGGNLLRIDEKANVYYPVFDINYCNHKECTSKYRQKILDAKTVYDYVDIIPYLKTEMDIFFHEHPKLEREIQQHILRENNNTSKSKQTDYYIIDIEYANSTIGCRFDMLALKWPSTAAARRNSAALGLSFIEVKYGDSALKGSAGIMKHFEDIHAFSKDEIKLKNFIDEVETILGQKLELGLISGISGEKDIKIDLEKLEFILLLANHDPDSSILNNELKSVINWGEYQNLKDRMGIKIARSSEMGYGLFDFDGNGHNTMISLEEYIDED